MPSGKCDKWRVVSTCEKCGGRNIIVYKGESRYIKEQEPFKCKQNKILACFDQEQGDKTGMIAMGHGHHTEIKGAGRSRQACNSWRAQMGT